MRIVTCSEEKRHDEHFQRSKQHAEVHSDYRIVDPMLQTLARRVRENTPIDRHMCLGLHQTVHAQTISCSPEGIQRCTQKFRNQKVRYTLVNDIRISKRQLFFEPTSCTSRQRLSVASSITFAQLLIDQSALSQCEVLDLCRV